MPKHDPKVGASDASPPLSDAGKKTGSTTRRRTPDCMMFQGKVRRIHFVGIGGIGMSGIAEVLLTLDFEVTGSDLKRSAMVKRLQKRGATVYIGHSARNVGQADVVVRSTAVPTDNPEIQMARELRIPVIRRAGEKNMFNIASQYASARRVHTQYIYRVHHARTCQKCWPS